MLLVFGGVREIQWYIFVVVYDLNDLNVFMINCFLLIFFNPSAYEKLSGTSLCISQVLSMYLSFCFNSCTANVCS